VQAQATISPDNTNFQYSGRIDFANTKAPVLYYAGSSITTRFQGTSLKASFQDITGNNYIGFIIDGGEMIVKSGFSSNNASSQTIATGLANTTHDLIIVKRNGPTEGAIVFGGITLDNGKSLAAPPARPTRRIEIFGNSVSAGVNADNVNTNDDRTKTLDNGWNSYCNVLARKLNAEINNNGIPGIAVMTGTGYYPTSADVAYNKLSPFKGYYSNWDFSKYIPQLVILAYGVNDDGNNWVNSSNKETWKAKYKAILADLMDKYPAAHFVFLVPPMGEDRSRIEGFDIEIVKEVNNPRVHFYNFTTAPSPRGCHPAKAMHQAMADELYTYVNTLGIFESLAGIENLTAMNESVAVYPNPTNGNFSIELPPLFSGLNSELSILDLHGNSLYASTFYENPITIHATNQFSKGMYLLTIRTGNYSFIKKLILQ